ncbi:hypothetical protein PNA2_0119 [Pyrococcus sp. NA2]|uniref:DUF2178 domain-containing protein n=1 Tax=Pyrococcus sp. (strain NA2) TaxID=342949 RepID=UPI000209AE55|nr:DUF2178 domain-containing protein [Pyrococcus sp. NA2]AEC51037.1 hypothetical protein PNA2_0119 [Pyrococcus sp. NA2]
MNGLLIWTLIVITFTAILLHLSKEEEKKVLIPAVIVILTMGYVLGWAVSNGDLALAFATLIVGALVVNLYYASLRRKGYILEDERTLRIEEISARRTLQVLMITLAFLVVYLSIVQKKSPELRYAFILAEFVLVFTMLLHIAFRRYYGRVM